MRTAIFTIASKNYFAYVRTLLQSLELSNPHMDRFAVVVDELDEEFISLPRNFELLELNKIDLPHPDQMKFRYSIMELNTAVKPFAILKLFESYDRVIYMDPDIFVYKKLQPVEDALDDGYNFVLTPHFNGLFEEDDMHPDETDIMRAGVYNLGFIALNRCADTIEMVSWWANKLEKTCINEQSKGIFVDQKWIDLVPGFYKNVRILHHSGLNVAYWNLSHRTITKEGNQFKVNGDPLIFFHFSGLNPNNINTISKHQNRYTLQDIGDGAELFVNYANIVLSNDFDMWKKFEYSYSTYTDGRPVLDEHRINYRQSNRLQDYCGENPFEYADIFYGNTQIQPATDGVNLIGYIRSEHGVGEAARLTANCLEASNINWTAYDYEVGNPCSKNDNTYQHKIKQFIKYDISIININADQFPVLRNNTPSDLWDTYKIGIWYWELPEFPDKWCKAFMDVDEIWAPTQFIADCLKKVSTPPPCPIYHMPPGIDYNLPDLTNYTREYFGLPKDSFLFLNMFDIYSFSGRKNPEAAVAAFKTAFSPDDMSVGLVLKINNSSYEDAVKEKLENLIGEYKNIYILAKTLPRAAVNGLINICDAAVSLHRSEGLGLLCEEAMYYGKPVIATGWSGNMDFMTNKNSCLVNYKLIPIGSDIGPYESWQTWADPSVSDAATYMKRLASDTDYYKKISIAARETIHMQFSPEQCSQKMKERLKQIRSMIDNGYCRNPHLQTVAFAHTCASCYQKIINKTLDSEQKKSLIASWIHNEMMDFDTFADCLADTELVNSGSNEQFITRLYNIFLERTPAKQEINVWTNKIKTQPEEKNARIYIIASFMRSDEFLGSYAKAYNAWYTPANKPTRSSSESTLFKELKKVNETWRLSYYFDLHCSGVKLFAKRVIRKMNRFLIAPLLDQQQAFNAHITRCTNEFNNKIFVLEQKNAELSTKLHELQTKTIPSSIGEKTSQLEGTLNCKLEQLCHQNTVLNDHILEIDGSRHNQIIHYLTELLNDSADNTSDKPTTLIKDAIRDKWALIDRCQSETLRADHSITCPICGHTFSSHSAERFVSECIFNGGTLLRYKCPHCGVIYGPEKMFALTDKELADDYKLHYSVYSEGDSTEQETELFYRLHPSKSGIYLNWGSGSWSRTIDNLRKEGYNVYGYDPYAPTDSEYIIKDEETLKTFSFDGIFSHDLLEHLRNPLEMFKLCSEILKPQGIMIHSTACYDYVYEYSRFHLFFYTGDSVNVLCNKSGFYIEQINKDSTNLLIDYTFRLNK